MTRYKDYSYDQGIMIPIDLTKQIVPGTIEHTIHWLVDKKIDTSRIAQRYRNDLSGAPAYDPAILLKIILFAYSRGIISSRMIMRVCRVNIVFRALSADSMPDFTTIASFVREMKDEIQSIFTNVLLVCHEMGLLGGTKFALDGCKISSNASKEMSGTFSDLAKKKEKIEATISFLITKQLNTDTKELENGSKKLYTKEDFTYNEILDVFICPAGKTLKYSGNQTFGNTYGRKYISSRSNCSHCEVRSKCVRSDKTRYRTLYVIEKFFNRNHSDEMRMKIDSAEGREIYSRRMGIVEPVFSNICYCKGLNRFTLRSKVKVNIRWVLYAIVHNIEKITKYGVLDGT